MAKDKKPAEKKAAKFREMMDEVKAGKDIVAAAQIVGAKDIINFKDALANNEIAIALAVPKRKGGRPTKYDPSWMLETVIEAGRLGATKEKMAALIGISKDTLYNWIEDNPEFSDAIKEAEMLSQVWWENAGQLAAIGTIDGFNATSWIFSMKNRFPDRYKDVKVTELNNTGNPLIDARKVVINARDLDDDVRENLRAALLAARLIESGGDNE